MDAVLALLFIALIGWVLLIGEAKGGDAMTTSGVIALGGVAYFVARFTTRYHDWLVPLGIVIAAGLFAYLRRDILFGGPLRAPLGYSNAAGSLYMIVAAAALIVFARSRNRAVRAGSLVAALACAAQPWLNQTTTATALVLLLPLALLARREATIRLTVLVGSTMAVASFAVVSYLGYTYTPGNVPAWIHATLSERRLMLWQDAIRLIAEEPLTGVGPANFPSRSPTAMADLDTIWPHNEVLHFGAETGVVAMVLFAGLVGVAFARLWWARGDSGTAVAAAALAAAAIHANVDYVMHYPAVPMAIAAVVGTGAERVRRTRAPRRRASH